MNFRETTLLNESIANADALSACVEVAPDATHEVPNAALADDLQRGGKRDCASSSTSKASANVFENELSFAERRYPFDTTKRWYVLRTYHGKVLDMKCWPTPNILYIPTLRVVEMVNGKRVMTEKPLITNLLFLYATEAASKQYVDGVSLFYQYNHCRKNEYGRSTPMQVGYKEMINFINATSTDEEDVRLVDETRVIHYKSGDMVEVVAGPFKGVRGRVARLAGQQRVIVELRDVCKFATTYIPNAWLRKCEAE